MRTGQIFRYDGQGQFSGHETFPMRYGWLKKAYDAVSQATEEDKVGSVFNNADAIAQFGVGKNMVNSIRHWATQCNVIEHGGKSVQTPIGMVGEKIFNDQGLDPYMENPSTLWLLHWMLATNERLVTWFWVFSYFHGDIFERETIVNKILQVCEEHGWTRVSRATLKRDVECFVRTYAPKTATKRQTLEDTLESPLTELGLIKPVGKKDGFRMVRGAKPTLGNGVFAYAVARFWESQDIYSSTNSLSLEAIAHQPGSPGRIFQLSEDDLAERLIQLEEVTNGTMRWSETAGLKQLIRNEAIPNELAEQFINLDYDLSEE